MTNQTLITTAWELYGEGVPKIPIAQKLGKHRETSIYGYRIYRIKASYHLSTSMRMQRNDHGLKDKLMGSLNIGYGIYGNESLIVVEKKFSISLRKKKHLIWPYPTSMIFFMKNIS